MRAYLPNYELAMPATLGEALQMLATGSWQPFAGGTDLMVLLEAGKLTHTQFISLWHLPELRGIAVTNEYVTLGALTTYAQIQKHDVLQKEFPLLGEAASLTGSVAIQNRGTLGGNIANASPAADSLPALLTFEAEVELVSTNGARWVAYRDFHTGYKTTLRRREELIRAVRLPRATAGWRQYMRKVGARKAQAISKVCLAGLALLEGTTLIDIRLAYGSVAPVPWRAVQTEAILRGCAVDDAAALQRARAALAAELRPIDDVRSTAVYRTQVAGNLLEEMWLGLR